MVLDTIPRAKPSLLRCMELPSLCRLVQPTQQDKGIELGKWVDHRNPPVGGRVSRLSLPLPHRDNRSSLPALRYGPQARQPLEEGSE